MLIANFRCATPARGGAFARLAVRRGGGEKRVQVVRDRFWRTRFSRSIVRNASRSHRSMPFGRLGLDLVTFAPARSSPLSIAMRPRVAAGSPSGGASLRRRRRPSVPSTSARVPGRVGRRGAIRLCPQASILHRHAHLLGHLGRRGIPCEGHGNIHFWANSLRSGVATIQPSKRLLKCLPAETTAASSSGRRSRPRAFRWGRWHAAYGQAPCSIGCCGNFRVYSASEVGSGVDCSLAHPGKLYNESIPSIPSS